MIKRLRVKFVCINMTIVTLMLCIIFALVFYFTRMNLEQDCISMMQNIAASPMRQFIPGGEGSDLNLPYFSLELGPNGEVLEAGGGFFDLSDDQVLQQMVLEARKSAEHVGVLKDYNLRYCEIYTPTGHYIVFADMTSEQNTIRSLVKNCALIGGGSFLIFLGLSVLLAFWAVKPVEKAWKQQRQFVADASHELKTPLTVILTNAAILRESEGVLPQSPFAGNILTMSQQMKELIESLLSLARVDNGIPKAERARLDFSTLVEDALLPFEALFYENGLAVETRVEPNLFVSGSEARLRQVVEIFLDNARKYALPHSTVTVALRRVGGRYCQLTVSNPGEPMTKEELSNIFKRFYRRDQAHTRDGSYGLGLPIAEGIVKEHRGRIWAESQGGITSFHVRLHLGN